MSGDLGIAHRAKTSGAGAIGREPGARDRYMDCALPSVAVIANVPPYGSASPRSWTKFTTAKTLSSSRNWGSRWPLSSGLERLEKRRESISLEPLAETVPIHFDVA